MINGKAFAGLDDSGIRKYIQDCFYRIGTNPNDKKYVSVQQDLIKVAENELMNRRKKA